MGAATDLALALDQAVFARALKVEPDPWQRALLRSTSDRVLLNCCRQSGKSTMTAIIALHRALYHPGSLILCLAPALRQSQELFGKVLGFYRDLSRPVSPQAQRKLSLELENESRIVTLPGSEKTVTSIGGRATTTTCPRYGTRLLVDAAAQECSSPRGGEECRVSEARRMVG